MCVGPRLAESQLVGQHIVPDPATGDRRRTRGLLRRMLEFRRKSGVAQMGSDRAAPGSMVAQSVPAIGPGGNMRQAAVLLLITIGACATRVRNRLAARLLGKPPQTKILAPLVPAADQLALLEERRSEDRPQQEACVRFLANRLPRAGTWSVPLNSPTPEYVQHKS